MTKFSKSKCQWGEFVDVKINAPEMLKRELFGLKKGLVSLSTVTDPYQAPERKYRLTRRILEELAAYNFSVSILTKSNLILRDIDILKKFERNNLEVGFSITTLDEEVRRHFKGTVFNTIIPRNVRLSEAPSYGMPIILYDDKSKGALSYLSLAKELIKREDSNG